MIVDDVLAEVGGDLFTCGPDATCLEAARVLRQHRIGLLLVCEGDANVGVLSERDIVRTIAEVGLGPVDSYRSQMMAPTRNSMAM